MKKESKYPNNLRAWRKQNGDSQDVLAAVLRKIGDAGAGKQKIYKLESGAQKMTAEELIAFSRYFGCKPEDLVGPPSAPYPDRSFNAPAPILYAQGLREDSYRASDLIKQVPIMGSVGGDRYAINNGESVLDWTKPFSGQENDKGAFALLVADETMTPIVRPGHLVFTSTRRPTVGGELCIVEMKTGDGVLKNYVDRTTSKIICEQLNPAKRIELKASDVARVLLVVGVRYTKW